MQRPNEDIMVQRCDICGDCGWPETLVSCCKCNVNREHVYCMRTNTIIIPEDWLCESCQSECIATSPCKVNQDIGTRASERQQVLKTRKVKFLPKDEVIRLSSLNITMKPSKSIIPKVPSLTPKSNLNISPSQVLGNLPRNDEVHKNPMTNQYASCSLSKGPPKECIVENQLPLGGVIPDKEVQTHDLRKEKPTKGAPFEALSATKSSPIVCSGAIHCADAECNQSNIEKRDLQSIQDNLNLHHKFLPYSIPAWRGQFQILETAASIKFYDGFEAQPPCVVNKKAYKFSRQMPSVLQLEALPALNVMTDIFQDDSPKLWDIALYFFPSEHTERSRKYLSSILKFMNAEKSMLRSYIDGVELLVFTSDQLDSDSKGAIDAVSAGCFLWGTFRRCKIDKAIGKVPKMELIDMDVDMIGGQDIAGRVDCVKKDKPKIVSMMEPIDMDIDMIGGKDVVGRVDCVQNDKPNSVSVMEPVDMGIYVIGGKNEVGRVDHVRKDNPKSVSLMEYHANLDIPPGFEAFPKMSSC